MSYSYAEQLSLTAFLNALLNEWQGYQKADNEIRIASAVGELVLPLQQDSLVQRYRFNFPAKLCLADNETVLSYQDVVDFICSHPAITGEFSAEQVALFKQQVQASQQHMAAVTEKRTAPLSIDGFIAAEQSLLGGHNLHPAGKSHQGWSTEQAQAYSPDYAGEFSLHWYLVRADLVAGESAFAIESEMEKQKVDVKASLTQLLGQSFQDAGIDLVVPDGYLPFPVHPHQAAEMLKNTSVQQYIADGLIVELNTQGRPWRATSSTRALWQQDSRWMLKFSLAVKLTNSIRHLSPTELSRGVLFQQVSNELAGAEFKQRFPAFNVLQEPAWCGLQDLAGELILDSLFCWRENPFKTGNETCVTLATMTQENSDGSNPIAKLVAQFAAEQKLSLSAASAIWFEHFLDNVITPVAVARSDYGLVMLAHQQNLLVTLANGLPVGGAFRDCQGTGYTDTALTRFKLLNENKPAYFADSDSLNPYFSYYLILNSLNSVIAALSSVLPVADSKVFIKMSQQLWLKLRQHSFYDTSFYDYLLQADNLKIKGNFFCFLGVQNETELQDPSRIYVDYPNPFQCKDHDSDVIRTFKPLLLSPDAAEEKGQALSLIFEQEGYSENSEKMKFTVATCLQQWAFVCRIDDTGSHHISLDETNPVMTNVERMTVKQWFAVLEHVFIGLGRNTGIVQVTQALWQQLVDAEIPRWVSLVAGQIIINRSEFFQFAGIWNQSNSLNTIDSADSKEEPILAANGNTHPVRPAQPEGVWFQRYIYPLNRVISFRCADVTRDLVTFNHWHNRPEISRMWELAGDLDSHQDYLNKQTADAHAMSVIGYFDGVPFGYFEVYWTPEDRLGPYYEYQAYDRGVHMLVGNPLFLGGENFVNWAAAIEHAVFVDDDRTAQIMGEPRADNKHVARITQKIGMTKLKEFDFPHKRAALLCCTRETFFNSIV